MILAIDSGANLGWAIFEDGKLLGCGLCRTTEGLHGLAKEMIFPPGGKTHIRRLIIERPHAGKTRARARDILTLAIRAGECGGVLRYTLGVEPEYIEPQTWKGQMPKTVCNRAVERKLSPEELRVLENIRPKSAKHNVLDAVGIGLHALGRFP